MRRAATCERENTRLEAMLEMRQVGPDMVRGAGARLRDHGCEPLRLWVVRGSHTIHCGECRDN